MTQETEGSQKKRNVRNEAAVIWEVTGKIRWLPASIETPAYR